MTPAGKTQNIVFTEADCVIVARLADWLSGGRNFTLAERIRLKILLSKFGRKRRKIRMREVRNA